MPSPFVSHAPAQFGGPVFENRNPASASASPMSTAPSLLQSPMGIATIGIPTAVSEPITLVIVTLGVKVPAL